MRRTQHAPRPDTPDAAMRDPPRTPRHADVYLPTSLPWAVHARRRSLRVPNGCVSAPMPTTPIGLRRRHAPSWGRPDARCECSGRSAQQARHVMAPHCARRCARVAAYQARPRQRAAAHGTGRLRCRQCSARRAAMRRVRRDWFGAGAFGAKRPCRRGTPSQRAAAGCNAQRCARRPRTHAGANDERAAAQRHRLLCRDRPCRSGAARRGLPAAHARVQRTRCAA
jgi:hypothetical protein